MMDRKTDDADWFWSIVESAQCDLLKLSRALEALSKSELIKYQCQCWHAKEDVNPYSQSEDFEFTGLTCSEDDADDFAAWVVGKGRTFSENVRNNYEHVPDIFIHYQSGNEKWLDSIGPTEYRGARRLDILAKAVYRKKFGEDLDEAVEEALDEEYGK